MFSRLGSKVTILQRSNRILSAEQEDLTSELEKYFKEEGITIVTGNTVKSVTETNGLVSVKTVVNGKELEVNAQKIIIATGRTANTDNMNLEKVGVGLNPNGSVQVDEYLQTSVPTMLTQGAILSKDGLNPQEIMFHSQKHKELLELDVDILVLAAMENQITENNASKIKANIILEIANGPITSTADTILQKQALNIFAISEQRDTTLRTAAYLDGVTKISGAIKVTNLKKLLFKTLCPDILFRGS